MLCIAVCNTDKKTTNECNYRAKRVVFRTNPINMAGYQLHYNTPKVIEEPRGLQQYLLSQLYSGLWRKIRLIYYPQQLAAPCGEESRHKLSQCTVCHTETHTVCETRAMGRGGLFGNVCLSSNFIPPPLALPQRPKRELAEHGSAYMPKQRYRSKPTVHTHAYIYTLCLVCVCRYKCTYTLGKTHLYSET